MAFAAMLMGRRAMLVGLASVAGHAWASQASTALAAAARREGSVVLYTSIDLPVAEVMAGGFRAAFPDIDLLIERLGSGRITLRVDHELRHGRAQADVVESTDIGSFADWKARGLLASCVPESVEQHWPAAERDPDGCFASVRAQLSVIAYNTSQVQHSEAPLGYCDLLQGRWRGRLVKAHPAHSGTILAGTHAIAQTLGWAYFEKLAGQDVLQVQCSAEPARMVVHGVRAVMADGSESVATLLRGANAPIGTIFPIEGTPMVSGLAGVLQQAPHPNAARLLAGYMFSRACQNLLVQAGGLRSFHPGVTPMAGMRKLDEIRLLRPDAVTLWAERAANIGRYRASFDG